MQEIARQHLEEVNDGERFEFGKNWSNFLRLLDEERILQAEESLRSMLEAEDLRGKTFLDIGSGSGLFSLAARRLGAEVFSFDFDNNSVACTAELRQRYFPGDANWKVEQGSALDGKYIESLGKFDIVYSWGVLHHTGKMWLGLENAATAVADRGKLFIAIYNDTGSQAARWKWIKKTYNKMPKVLHIPFTALVYLPEELKQIAKSLMTLNPGKYIDSWTKYTGKRGMNRWYDMVDWIGGFPYEVATPDEIFEYYKSKGFVLTKLVCGYVGLGCNEFVFRK